jgi:hypothetical protein
MAGTGLHPEGHVWKPYDGTLSGYTHICKNCAQLTCDLDGDNGDCIDDC